MPFQARVLLPRFGATRRLPGHAIMLGVHRDSTHPDAALQFLDFCYDTCVDNNPAFPFAHHEADRRYLAEEPALHELLQEAMSQAQEPLQEGVPQRTWAIEKEIYRWYRLLQNREQTMQSLQAHWKQDWTDQFQLPRHAVFGVMDYRQERIFKCGSEIIPGADHEM